MVNTPWDSIFLEHSDCWEHLQDCLGSMRSTHGEPLGRQVEQLRVEGVSDRKGADSSFATQRIRQIHRGTQTVLIQIHSHRCSHIHRQTSQIFREKD